MAADPVGNDVVDLEWVGVAAPEFRARILGPGEPGDRIWHRWAAKETAHKIWARDDWELPWTPWHFVVDLERGRVSRGGRMVQVAWTELACGAISCWGSSGGTVLATAGTVAAEVGGAPLSGAEAPARLSQAVRRLAKRFAAEHLGLEEAALEVRRPVRDVGGRAVVGPPELWWRGTPLQHTSLSLAHDGRFVGCALGVGGLSPRAAAAG